MVPIDKATLQDIPQMSELLQLLFTQESEMVPNREKQERALRLILQTPNVGSIFVARVGREVVGMVSLLFNISTVEGGPACWLEDLIVSPGHRGKGIGSALIRNAIQYAHTHGFKRITLLADNTNDHGIRFYEDHGFQVSQMTAMRLAIN